jgi:hypothetical protein
MCTSRSVSRRNQTTGMAAPTSRQGRPGASDARMQNTEQFRTQQNLANAGGTVSRRRGVCRVEDTPVPPHRVHHHGKFARQGGPKTRTVNYCSRAERKMNIKR